jgi:hypothetical protein
MGLRLHLFLMLRGWTSTRRIADATSMKNFVVGVLCLSLSQIAIAQGTVQETVVKIDKGSAVEVRLKSKEKVRGRLGDVSSSGFTVQVTKNGAVTSRDIAFDDVKSLKRTGKPGKVGYVAMAVGFAAVGAGIVVAVAFWQLTHWH